MPPPNTFDSFRFLHPNIIQFLPIYTPKYTSDSFKVELTTLPHQLGLLSVVLSLVHMADNQLDEDDLWDTLEILGINRYTVHLVREIGTMTGKNSHSGTKSEYSSLTNCNEN